jgi:23S rRNA (uracil1939-C5)-methyltransferase
MCVFTFYDNDEEKINLLLNHIKEKFPQITSLLFVINQKGNDTFYDLPVQTFSGRDFIYEEMEGLKFKVGPKSFYQTNSKQAYNLYKITREFAGLTGNENVYDLYTGTGTIAQFIAKQAKHVAGIEFVPEAIEDAKVNAALNNIKNVSFYAGDMKDVLNDEFITQHGKPDVIITDPPRAGMHPDVVNKILELSPAKIVYVSCNPSTQARDISLLAQKYTVSKTQAVDMFPQTLHVESVALLRLK